ncbi:Stealth CR1 domain-containing protein [Tenacibaculum aquimarinum]|uniref:Stealth CR1 domain-containing protein n=1 Tax=Tenacibaculum aquimarinum TaxID=2910675 RepID=UPI001F0AFC96|nr:Stealth CR1 domain-containing protein [Tenacibaculum aquimarinum]MCH3885332.1 stealth family protein [Tenacibaculum aquimarinum]
MIQDDNKHPIDAVITWVDSSDVVWQNKINQFLEKKIDWNNKKDSTRYNSINEIDIAILSIIKYAKFIKNIYLVTDNQQPDNFEQLQQKAKENNVNLELIDHKIIFRDYKEYLPTFNSQSIETLLYKIPNLLEHFIYFNDDMFLINKTKPSDFFIDGFPVLRGKWVEYNENILFKRMFTSKNENNKVTHRKAKETGSKLVGFKKNYTFYHTPYPLRKSTFENYFNKNEDILIRNIHNKFRDLEQYVPQSLINHLEIKNKTWVEESKISLMYFQSYNFFKFIFKFKKLESRGDFLFMCLQSLELAPKKTLKYLLTWIDKKLETNFNETVN